MGCVNVMMDRRKVGGGGEVEEVREVLGEVLREADLGLGALLPQPAKKNPAELHRRIACNRPVPTSPRPGYLALCT